MGVGSDNSRKKELLSVFDETPEGIQIIVRNLVDDMVHLEKQLSELRGLPWLLIDTKNSSFQKRTEAASLYASLISRYVDIINKLSAILRRQEVEEESPLREYLKTMEGFGDE